MHRIYQNMISHHAGDAEWEPKHNDGIEHSYIHTKLQSIGRDDAEEISRECFMFYFTTVLFTSSISKFPSKLLCEWRCPHVESILKFFSRELRN